jgi:hypothetical protein
MLNCVKSFGKIKFEDDNFLPTVMTLMNVLKTPSNAILNGSGSNKTILISMEKL